MADQIEMSTADQTTPITTSFGSNLGVNRQLFTTPRPSLFNHMVSRSLNTSWIPFNVSMARHSQRVVSFDDKWPQQIAQRAHQMVASGFYYTGKGDTVTCFMCGITLCQWERGDEIDIEHKKHSPECKFLYMCRQV